VSLSFAGPNMGVVVRLGVVYGGEVGGCDECGVVVRLVGVVVRLGVMSVGWW